MDCNDLVAPSEDRALEVRKRFQLLWLHSRVAQLELATRCCRYAVCARIATPPPAARRGLCSRRFTFARALYLKVISMARGLLLLLLAAAALAARAAVTDGAAATAPQPTVTDGAAATTAPTVVTTGGALRGAVDLSLIHI